MVPKWDLDQLAHDHRAGQNLALLFDLIEARQAQDHVVVHPVAAVALAALD